MSRSDWDRHIEWKSAVLWNRQYNSAEDVKNKGSSLGVSREMFIAEAGDDMIRVSMVPGAGKVTDTGYDQFACCAAEVPAGYDVRISAEIKAVISGGGNSNQEAWGIFIRDTLARDPETGYPYSNCIHGCAWGIFRHPPQRIPARCKGSNPVPAEADPGYLSCLFLCSLLYW